MVPKLILKTKEELDALLLFLDVVKRKIFNKEVFEISELEEKLGRYLWFKQVWRMFGEDISGNYNEKLKVLRDLEQWARGLEQVKIVLPFHPSQKFIDDAYGSLILLKPSGFVLDVSLDKTITSGGKLFHGGRYIDLTFKPKILSLMKTEDVVTKYL